MTAQDLLESLVKRLLTPLGIAWLTFGLLLRKYPGLALQALDLRVLFTGTYLVGGMLAALRVPVYVQAEFWLASMLPSYALRILNIYRKTRFKGLKARRQIWSEIVLLYAVALIAACTGAWFLVFSGVFGYSTPILIGPTLNPVAALISGCALLPIVLLARLGMNRDLRKAARQLNVPALSP